MFNCRMEDNAAACDTLTFEDDDISEKCNLKAVNAFRISVMKCSQFIDDAEKNSFLRK
jgi:hypothetical protein